jgi:uncharacterized OB-fold protein
LARCDDCGRDAAVDQLPPEGGCPTCGREAEVPTAPWHFKLLVVATVIYLGWRAWQGLAWVIQKL